jgi:hypothetical protein
MASRLYLSTTATPDVSPGFDGGWTSSASGVRYQCSPTNGASAMATSGLVSVTSGAGNHSLCVQFVSPPLAAQTLSGTVSAIMMENEGAANDNINRPYMSIRVVQSDGTTIRGTILALGIQTGAYTTEITTTAATTTFANAASLSSLAVSEGDRLVIEMGYGLSATGTTPNFQLRWGESAGSDGTIGTNGSTTDINGFVEFSAAIVWSLNQSFNDTLTVTDSLVSNAEFARVLNDSGDTLTVTDAIEASRFDTTTQAFSGYWRIDSNEYSGPTWTATASAGTSGTTGGDLGQDGANGYPSQGTQLAVGYYPARYTAASSQRLLVPGRSYDYFATNFQAGGIFAVVKFASLHTEDATAAKNCTIIADTGIYMGLGASSGGAHAVNNPNQGGAGNGIVKTGSLDTTNWHVLAMRWDATTLYLSVDGGVEASAPLDTTGGDQSWPIKSGVDGTAAHFLDAEVAEIALWVTTPTATDVSNYVKGISDRLGITIATSGNEQTFSDSLTVSDSLTATTVYAARVMSDVTETVTDAVSSTATYERAFADTTETVTDALVQEKTSSRTFADVTETVTDSFTQEVTYAPVFADAAEVVTDALAQEAFYAQTFADTSEAVSDSLSAGLQFEQVFADTSEIVSDSLTQQLVTGGTTYAQTFSDVTESVSDAFAQEVAYERIASDVGETVSDALTQGASYDRSVSDALTVGDSVAQTVTYERMAADVTEAVGDAFAQEVTYASSFADAVTASDALAQEASYSRTFADTSEVVSDDISYAAAGSISVSFSDAVDATDALAQEAFYTYSQAFADSGEVVDDSLTVSLVYEVTFADSVAATDAISVSSAGTFDSVSSDAVDVTDALLQALDTSVTWSDVETVTDALALSVEYGARVADAVSVDDALLTEVVYDRGDADAIDVTDAIDAVVQHAGEIVESDAVDVSDSLLVSLTCERGFADAVGVVDALAAQKLHYYRGHAVAVNVTTRARALNVTASGRARCTTPTRSVRPSRVA